MSYVQYGLSAGGYMRNSSYSSMVAKFYDDFLKDYSEDVDIIKTLIRDETKTILELAVGTGRMLIPLLQAGYVSDGLDNSQDMLNIAKAKIDSLKLKSHLYNEDMTCFDIKKKYDLAFIGCGSFMVVDAAGGEKTLHCIKNHLNKNGELLLDIFIPWDDIQNKNNNAMNLVRDSKIKEERCLVYESFSIDVNEQRKYGTYKYEYYKNNKLKEVEVNHLDLKWYYEDEIVALLEKTGFCEVEVIKNIASYIKDDSFIVRARNKD